MSSIFGDEAQGELFSARNGMLLYTKAEQRFDMGYFALVPDVDPDSPASIDNWNNSAIKEYKIKVFDSTHPSMKESSVPLLIRIREHGMTWMVPESNSARNFDQGHVIFIFTTSPQY